MMNTKMQVVSFISTITLVFLVNGHSTKGVKDKLKEIRNYWNRDTKDPGHSLNVLSNGKTSGLTSTFSFKSEELIKRCGHVRGVDRKMCIGSLARTFASNMPRKEKKESNTQKNTTKVISSDSRNSELLDSSAATKITSNEPNRDLTTVRKTLQTNTVIQKPPVLSSAVLIVPGYKRKVVPVVEDTEGKFGQKQIVAVKPVTCRKEEFGFADDADPKFVDLASDMLCSLCKHQGDGLCIVRWCLK